MNRSLQKQIERNNVNQINFEQLTQQHGYVQARQMLRQKTIQQQQTNIKRSEEELNNSKRAQRLQESIYLGSVFGTVDMDDTILQRIVRGECMALLTWIMMSHSVTELIMM